jgi:hypothetical protein
MSENTYVVYVDRRETPPRVSVGCPKLGTRVLQDGSWIDAIRLMTAGAIREDDR